MVRALNSKFVFFLPKKMDQVVFKQTAFSHDHSPTTFEMSVLLGRSGRFIEYTVKIPIRYSAKICFRQKSKVKYYKILYFSCFLNLFENSFAENLTVQYWHGKTKSATLSSSSLLYQCLYCAQRFFSSWIVIV